eukprot:jgi/Psemu1/48870/gm1.48870_g
MTSSKAQILQALQAKIDRQKIASSNPVDLNPSAPLSQQEDDDNDSWLFYDSDSDSETSNSKDNLADPGWERLLSLHGIDCKRIPNWIIHTFPKLRYLPHLNEEVILLDQNNQEAILCCWNETRRQDEDTVQHTHQERQITDPDTPPEHNGPTIIHPLGHRHPSYGDYSASRHLVDDDHVQALEQAKHAGRVGTHRQTNSTLPGTDIYVLQRQLKQTKAEFPPWQHRPQHQQHQHYKDKYGHGKYGHGMMGDKAILAMATWLNQNQATTLHITSFTASAQTIHKLHMRGNQLSSGNNNSDQYYRDCRGQEATIGIQLDCIMHKARSQRAV